jgi:PAS domain S-box-containing protein
MLDQVGNKNVVLSVESIATENVEQGDKPLRILHLDADSAFLAATKQFLSVHFQLEVENESTFEQALEKLKTSTYDAVVSAYQLDEKNGLELLKTLRQRGNVTPFILLTFKDREEIAIEALNSGVDWYIAKGSDAAAMYTQLAKSIFASVKTRRTERQLVESEEKYRREVEDANDAIFLADVETGIILDCNRAATILMAKPKEELVGTHQRQLHSNPAEGEVGFKQSAEAKENCAFEAQILTGKGEIKDVAIKASLVVINGRSVLMGIFRDITAIKKAMGTVKFQANLLKAVGQPLVAANSMSEVTYWNDAAEKAYGRSRAEMLGKNIVTEFILKTFAQNEIGMIARLRNGESVTLETVVKRSDDDRLPMILTISPLLNDKSEFDGAVAVATDISQQKWMQQVLEESVEAVSALNEKLRVVDSLTRHDIRNKLAALDGRLYLLKKRLAGNADALDQVVEIGKASNQILRILEFERLYVQVGSEELKLVDVEKLVAEAQGLFSDLKGAEVINCCQGLTLLADSLLRQIFYNLIDNTLKYGEKVRKIAVYYEEADDVLKLIYEDDGVGMSEDVRGKLFTEGFGRGTGYGLYLIKRICEAYGWQIQETGKQGIGAQFTMTIPKKNKEGKSNYAVTLNP